MSKAPTMPMFWDAYLADTTHLTTEEHGAYLLLLAAMWRRNGWVPDEDKDNARILGLTVAKWRRVKVRLSQFLIYENHHITQKNLLKIWKNTQEKIAVNVVNGAKGGRAAACKINDLAQANAKDSLKRKATIPEPEPEPEKKEDADASLSVTPDAPQVANDLSHAVARYNKAAGIAAWPQVQKITPSRSKQLRARLKDCGGVEGWDDALRKALASDFCRGRTAKVWSGFGFDWIIESQNFTKLMEGNYDNRTNDAQNNAKTGGGGQPTSIARLVAQRQLERRNQAGGDI